VLRRILLPEENLPQGMPCAACAAASVAGWLRAQTGGAAAHSALTQVPFIMVPDGRLLSVVARQWAFGPGSLELAALLEQDPGWQSVLRDATSAQAHSTDWAAIWVRSRSMSALARSGLPGNPTVQAYLLARIEGRSAPLPAHAAIVTTKVFTRLPEDPHLQETHAFDSSEVECARATGAVSRELQTAINTVARRHQQWVYRVYQPDLWDPRRRGMVNAQRRRDEVETDYLTALLDATEVEDWCQSIGPDTDVDAAIKRRVQLVEKRINKNLNQRQTPRRHRDEWVPEGTRRLKQLLHDRGVRYH
jgi:hypothetical protein